MFIPDLDRVIFCHPGSQILDPGSYVKKRQVQNKLIFFLPDQMINVVNVNSKLNFLYFSIILKGINLIIYKFHYLKFNFSHVWDPRSGIRKKIILDPALRSLGGKTSDPGSRSAILFLLPVLGC
jgi:hypothetical protein